MDIILKQQETISRKQTVPGETLERNNCVRSTYFVVWFGFRWLLEKAALPIVTAQHVTHTFNSTYGARNKQTRTTWRELNVIQTAKDLKAVTLPRAGKDLTVPRCLMA